MSYCQTCGNEVSGNFCQNCGAAINITPSFSAKEIVKENTTIKARYKAVHVILAAYFGFFGLIVAFISVMGVFVALGAGSFGATIGMILSICFGLSITFLAYRPGMRSIRKNTPEEELSKVRKCFIKKTIIALPALAVSIMGCAFIVGILLGAWRIAVKACSPRPIDYTAFVDDKKITVIRTVDSTFSSYDNIRYIYIDREGNRYRETMY